eukprot:6007341-Prymnesium_polylepis.1
MAIAWQSHGNRMAIAWQSVGAAQLDRLTRPPHATQRASGSKYVLYAAACVLWPQRRWNGGVGRGGPRRTRRHALARGH